MAGPWKIALDRGGTFTDFCAVDPAGGFHRHKCLSDDGAALRGVRAIIGDSGGHAAGPIAGSAGACSRGRAAEAPGPFGRTGEAPAASHPRGRSLPLAPGVAAGTLPPLELRVGTTVATNALLTRSGVPTGLLITRGFRDLLAIGEQDRPEIFDLASRRPPPLYRLACEVTERLDAGGRVITDLDEDDLDLALGTLKAAGCRALAIVFLHSFRHGEHERRAAAAARAVGFDPVIASGELCPVIHAVGRGETTVAEAALAPVLRGYVQRLRADFPETPIAVMQSSGALAGAEDVRAHATLLSGPAGGAVAVQRHAARHGLAQVIGLDMGGTSTDVCRVTGTAMELEGERRVAGLRLRTPTLAIETVAAGGGSICALTDGRLTVGPASAGADPGPACYGRGGPLTVTDVHLCLGRLEPERFPFPLDGAAARRRLAALADAVGVASEALALDLLAIADEAMARAIRRISVERGVDPAEHVLVGFGGAGGLHACALAERLGIGRVHLPAEAGIFSALGILQADAATTITTSVLAPLDDDALRRLPCAGPDEQRHLALRYRGVQEAIEMPWPAAGMSATELRRAYEAEHERRLGFRHQDRSIEIVALRTTRLIARGATLARTAPAPAETPPVLRGPRVLAQAHATAWLATGWQARPLDDGGWELTPEPTATPSRRAHQAAAAIEILHHRFMAIAEQMGADLRRLAVSTNMRERLDFSCAVFDERSRLLANAPHIPVHLGAMGATVAALQTRHAGAIAPGDAFLSNDPAEGGSHLPDLTLALPVFHEGRPAFWVAARGHHADIGGPTPGSMPAASRRLAEEGIVIAGFKLLDAGRWDEPGLRALLTSGPHPARQPGERLADLRAQLAACRRGERLLGELLAERRREELATVQAAILAHSAAALAAALARLAPGTREAGDELDDGSRIHLRLTIADGRAEFDFRGSSPAQSGNLNAPAAVTRAAVLYVLRCLVDRPIPLNDGFLDPVTIRLGPGSILDPPAGAAVAGGNVETSQRVVDVCLEALGLAANAQGSMNNLSFGDADFGYYETLGGGAGATRDSPGADGLHSHMTNTRLTDVEILESLYPVRVRAFALRPHSGGSGARRGGHGLVRTLEFGRELTLSILSERRRTRPRGLAGGGPGAMGLNLLWRRGASAAEVLGGHVQGRVGPGDVLEIRTPGGGGYGPPSSAQTGR